MILSAEDKQFTLQADGRIFYQSNPTNPLPGVYVGEIIRGDTILSPKAVALDGAAQDTDALQTRLQVFLDAHLRQVLEPLFGLKAEKEGDIKPVCHELASHVYGAMGTVPRADVDYLTSQLDQDDRRVLRNWKIRLGPILVFQPDLNKPAAVRLRGLLWNLFHEKSLPAAVPPDGMVSMRTEGEAVDPQFFRAIGYPVYGPRAIRIDMLDRVINAVYEAAEGGQFKAQHQMAEWLGCSIEDLYAILEAMGHKKVYDPADEQKAEQEQAQAQETGEVKPAEEPKDSPTETPAQDVTAPEAPVSEAAADGQAQKPAEQAKPELATFRLKKGKAFSKPHQGGAQKHKSHKDKPKKSGKRNKHSNKSPKITEIGPKPKLEDSPFAVLQQLKGK